MGEHLIELESGTCTKRVRQHDGYYAGDFSAAPPADLRPWFQWGQAEARRRTRSGEGWPRVGSVPARSFTQS